MKIFQVAESLAIGDAVANDVVALDGLLKEKDICGGIFISNKNNISSRYIHKIAEPVSEMPELSEEDVLLFHHAISNDFCYELPKLKCRKILVYHNITPPHFFEGIHIGFRDATQKGLDQIKLLKNEFECCIAASVFNKEDLRKLGYTCPIFVCPILVPFDDYKQKPSDHIISKYSDGWTNILFVGRLSPNKKQEDIVHAFALYKKYYNKKSRLFLVGSDGVEQYGLKLRKYIEDISVKDVFITGSVPFKDILAYYSIADVFVCMSEHEGFCVPLIESMFFNVPILAYDSCAVPQTLGDSGVILKHKDFLLAAGWVNQLVSNNTLRQMILDKQSKRLKYFEYDYVKKITWEILENIINKKVSITKTKNEDSKEFNVVIPIKASDWNNVKNNINLIQENLSPKKIVIIASSELRDELKDIDFIEFIDENELVPRMSLESVKQTLKKAGGNPDVAGWFLQQYLKYGYSTVCQEDYFLVWDADTLPINKISFFDNKTGKPYFNLKREYVPVYFTTLKNLLGIDRTVKESFITEHMIFDTKICRKLIKTIESNDNIKGEAFWEKCIFACDFNQNTNAFSEYETFGNYVTTYYPDSYEYRKLRTLRCGTEFLGYNPSNAILNWVSQDFDTVSFEHWSKPISKSATLCSSTIIRNNFKSTEIIDYICKDMKINACLGTNDDKEAYRQFCLRLDFDYYFGSKTIFEIDEYISKKRVKHNEK